MMMKKLSAPLILFLLAFSALAFEPIAKPLPTQATKPNDVQQALNAEDLNDIKLEEATESTNDAKAVKPSNAEPLAPKLSSSPKSENLEYASVSANADTVEGNLEMLYLMFPKYPRINSSAGKLGKYVLIENPKNGRFIIAGERTFLRTLKNPYPDFEKDLPSVTKIMRTFDRNRDEAILGDELVSLMVEMRYQFELAKNEADRNRVVARYTEPFRGTDVGELDVSWNGRPKFKVVFDEDAKKWKAVDTEPCARIKFGLHPSSDFVAKLDEKDHSRLALREFLNELQYINPYKRADKIIELLPKYLAKNYPQVDSQEWLQRNAKIGYMGKLVNLKSNVCDMDTLVEYINERHENVTVPVFFTDPENTVDDLSKFSEYNQGNLAPAESEELENYTESKN